MNSATRKYLVKKIPVDVALYKMLHLVKMIPVDVTLYKMLQRKLCITLMRGDVAVPCVNVPG